MTTNNATLAQLRPAQQSSNLPVSAGFFDLQGFELLQRTAKAFASSDLVPKQYQGNLANCMIAMDMAQRIGANPLMAMQNLYVVHGTPSWSSKFLIATINACGRFSALRYEWKGNPGEDDFGCRAWAVEKETGERLDGIWVTWKMVNAEGWSSKNGSKWKTMPDQMFIYRAAAFWQRAYAPELGMGLSTAEELHDVIDVNPDGTVASVTTTSLRNGNTMKNIEPEYPPAPSAEPPTGEVTGNTSKATEKPAENKPAITYAQIADLIQKATDVDMLDADADLIKEIANEDEQAELRDMYQQRREALSQPATQPQRTSRQRQAGMNID